MLFRIYGYIPLEKVCGPPSSPGSEANGPNQGMRALCLPQFRLYDIINRGTLRKYVICDRTCQRIDRYQIAKRPRLFTIGCINIYWYAKVTKGSICNEGMPKLWTWHAQSKKQLGVAIMHAHLSLSIYLYIYIYMC